MSPESKQLKAMDPNAKLSMIERVAYGLGFTGLCISCVGFILTAPAAVSGNVTMVVVCNLIKGFGFGCSAATMFGILQDAITYGQ